MGRGDGKVSKLAGISTISKAEIVNNLVFNLSFGTKKHFKFLVCTN